MFVAIVAWDLRASPVTFDELRAWVARTAADEYARLPGVNVKAWFSDERKRIWGAVYLVESIGDLDPERIPRLPDGRTGPIGTRPTSTAWFELEASVVGDIDVAGLHRQGRAFDIHES
ncbi:hypothetical protein [Virgisporangium aurantiacum]|uniref:Uncharacterized protein n=1 Tax=Virgisporangium aurantiacum TaxID=175570 RepID=A0A8J3ZLY1_9ACTN|nr:hypothetical protein [Virgisporangium aurantiacum]GIJ63830.1 hypothetical protein Vau01_113460 [Virgisporangium aurantiacum]